MELDVLRYTDNGDRTLALFLINNHFECYTIEDEERTVKVWGETRIPEGRYEVKLRTEGSFHQRYSQKFGSWHKGMLHITDVPGFKWILIHIGNTDDDTAGCLIPGLGVRDNQVVSSTSAYKKIYPLIVEELLAGRRVWINYKKIYS